MKQRLQELTGLRRKDLIVLAGSLLIGGGLIAGNFLHFNSVQNRFSTTYDQNPRELTITGDDPFEASFPIASPGRMETVRITFVFREVAPQTQFTFQVNGRVRGEVGGFRPGSSHLITLTGDQLQQENTVTVAGQFQFSSQATLQAVRVRGVTGLQRITFLLLNIIGIIVIIGPILLIKYMEYSRQSEMEEEFPNFLRDVVEGARAGMPLPQAIQNTRGNNYGQLTPYVEEMAAKLEWGIPFERAVRQFGRKTRSPIVQRAINTIIQTYQAGGDVAGVLEAVGNNLKEIRKLRKERQSQIYGEMITGYIIYFVFLGVLVVLIRFLLPSLTFSGSIGPLESTGLSAEELVATYRGVFRFLVIIQSIFSGMVIGRLSEGELKAGAKHVGILLGIGYTVSAVFM
ncbi:MAG: type II secretion system F family protein [Candidatus Nanohaloarchaea archaeon]|nr:type II secretion system F family protein [Candidatus Nanohaloarchaea archaeon]